MTNNEMQQTIEMQLENRMASGIRKIAKDLGIETTRATKAQLIVWVARELALSKNASKRANYRLG
jgi:hypothetical protein